jgi:hypothetical protein
MKMPVNPLIARAAPFTVLDKQLYTFTIKEYVIF